MPKYLTTEEEVKDALGIDSFRKLSKDKIIEFVSAMPHMDKDVAISIINQFPAYAKNATNMISQLREICDKVAEKNGESQKETIAAYVKILDNLGALLKKNNITAEERANITKQMVEIADKIAAKDTENKEFLQNIMKYGVSIIGGVLLLGAVILGVNVKGTKLPALTKK